MFGWMEKKTYDAVGADAGATLSDILITGDAGFLSGMHVATAFGWRAVEDLRAGDLVLSFDHGLQPIMDIQRETRLPAESGFRGDQSLILVPKGALENGADIWLMPEQGVLVESDTVLDIMDEPFAVLPAQALKGFRGIRSQVPQDPLRITTLAFRDDEVIYVEGGLLGYCPRPRSFLMDDPHTVPGLYDMLPPRAARYLVGCLIEDNEVGALVCDPEEIVAVAGRGRQSPQLVAQV